MYLSSKFEKKSLAYTGTTQKHHDYILFSVTAKKTITYGCPICRVPQFICNFINL